MSPRLAMAAFALVALSIRLPDNLAGQQGGLTGLGGLGDLTRSLFARDAYVGSRRFDLFHLESRDRLAGEGFSILPPPGDGWVRAAPLNEYRSDVIQEVWFVRGAHRFTAWADRTRITARPTTAFARLVFVGRRLDEPLPQSIERSKRTELRDSRVDVLSLAVHPDPHTGTACVRYEADVLDRGVPPGFSEQVFEVHAAGIVCPHPEAAWLAVEAGYARRRAPGQAADAGTAVLAAFVENLQLDRLTAPLVVDVRSADVPDGMVVHPATARTLIVGNELWMSYASVDRRTAVTRFDAELQPVADYRDYGPLVAATPRAIWLNRHDGTVTWIGTDSGDVVASQRGVCEPSLLARVVSFENPQQGVWLGCVLRQVASPERAIARGFVRLDPRTGAVTATVAVAEKPFELLPSGDALWALEEPIRMGDRFRVHRIDTLGNQIVRTLVLPKSDFVRLLVADQDELWITRERGRDREILVIDPATTGVRATLELPEWASIHDVASVDRDSLWLTADVAARDGPGLATLGATGALLRIDRRMKRLGRAMPVGIATRAAGTSAAGIWLHDRSGTFVRVSAGDAISGARTPSTAPSAPAGRRNDVKPSRAGTR
jgi:hypothetical protein